MGELKEPGKLENRKCQESVGSAGFFGRSWDERCLMNCKQAQAKILAGGLPDVERHLAECAECRAFARACRLAVGMTAEAAPPPALDACIRAMARERAAVNRRGGWRLLTPEVKLALAASFATVLAIGALMMAPYEGGDARPAAVPADESLLAWDADPVVAHGVPDAAEIVSDSGGAALAGEGDVHDADLEVAERCMDRLSAGSR